ncbi:thiolase family protein [Sphaerisporangium corydalis]|uniref:Probable acetyl-CoA acetyltransferase n=1 Tax=Sphaerisporangium corydalis TaxID=1441875 RepID=A0ABV9ECH4_9ACTN|nr:thiolase family protein [Sphaerisporangium corydalis]
MTEVYIVDAVRTPFGRYGGALSGVRPDDLAAHVVRALVERTPLLDPARIDDVFLGNANGAGEDNRDVARMAVLLAGLPVTVPGVSVNRLCGSGLEAVVQAGRAIAAGDASIVIAGGVESMTRAPWVLQKPGKAFPAAHQELYSTTLGWRMVNPRMPAEWTVALGEGAELIADRYGITRERQDAFALASHEKAARAWKDGAYDDEVVPLPAPGTAAATGIVPLGHDTPGAPASTAGTAGTPVRATGTPVNTAGPPRDESIRDDTSLESLARLKPAFRPDGGTVTAGNSSPLNDGAAALLLCDEDGLRAVGREPLARIRASAVTGIEPRYFGLGPVEAVGRALTRAGTNLADLTVFELNEAFAAQSLGCLDAWPELDPAIVNPLGGAIAIGHPLGASGARLAGAVARRLAAAGSGTGVAALCIGVGQGLALVLER